MRGGWGRKAAVCGMPRFLRPSGRSQCLRGWGALGREGHAAVCGLSRFLRPSGRSQRLRRAGGWGVRCMPRFAACRVSCGLWAARNACGKGRWGVGACRVLWLAAFLAAFGPLATLAGWGAGAWGACRALQPAAFLAAFGPLATLAPCGVGCGGVGCMPRFATCRVSCGLWAARNACGGWGALGRGGHAALCNLSRFLRPSGRSQRLLFCAAAQGFGALPQTPAGG